MKPRPSGALAIVLLLAIRAGGVGAQAPIPRAEKVDLCELKADPAAYDHRTIEVTGVVTHDFENFKVSAHGCRGGAWIWLEYGGEVNSHTIYCCGPVAGAHRGGTVIVEGVRVPLIPDALFRRFDAHVRSDRHVSFTATMVGRFFAGEKQLPGAGEFRGGYGHVGCCSLLMIQQVLAVGERTDEPAPVER